MSAAVATRSPAVVRAVDAVMVGASAGGVDALIALFSDLPPTWRLPLVTVLHLPEGHESRLAEVFRHRLPFDVREAEDKRPVLPSTLYFAPAGYHLSIERDRVFSLSCEPPVLYSRPSIDVLMASAADAYGPALGAFLLTGANFDGAAGLASIHAAGGFTAVQDPGEAQVSTMPMAAIARHTPDAVLPLSGLRALLLQLDSLHAS
ncbi:MAG: chemotaxis protein CheB [Variovorax sp.]|nr:MAG: chemotaxis protein CheB [Variovorax sp.]